MLLELGGARLLTDPLLRDRIGHLRRHGPSPAADVTENLDAVLISHLHLDHLDLRSLRRLPRDVRLLVPSGAGGFLRRQGFGHAEELRLGDRVRVGAAEVIATPADHDPRRHPFSGARADTLGFVVRASSSVYFAGDTDVFAGMGQLAGRLDLALLPVWGWGPSLGAGHMDPAAAARAVKLLAPRIAVPVHWGTFYPIGLTRLRGGRLVDPPHEFAAAVGDATQVRILAQGESTEL